MIVRGAFNVLLRPLMRNAFRDAYSDLPEEYPSFLNVGKQDGPYVEGVEMGGLPRMVSRGEAEPITYIDPMIGPVKEWVDEEFALGFSVSKRMMEDDQFGRAVQSSRWLGRSARLTQEFAAAAFLDDMFDGTLFTGLDDGALIGSHPLLRGGTWNNLIPNNPQLSVTGMQAAFETAHAMVDIDGNPWPFTPSRLIIGVQDEWAAIQLTQSELEPYTSDNQVNAIRKKLKNFSYFIPHYRTNTRAWALVDPGMSDAHFLFRVRPEFDDTFDFDTKAAKFSGRQRINVYFGSARGWVASNPA
jgi:hypothetical protein